MTGFASRRGTTRTAVFGSRDELPAWLWLWFPPSCLLGILLACNLTPEFYERWVRHEGGIVESGTALAAFAAAVAGLLALTYRRQLQARWLVGWVFAVTGASLYFGMEEISWGQHLFQWGTPDWIAAFNDQGETNLHNTSGLFDQLPRNLLMLWVIIGGIVAPIWARLRDGAAPLSPNPRSLFWPTHVCLPTAVLVILARLPDYLQGLAPSLPFAFYTDAGEVKEFFYALFLLLYLLSLWSRLRQSSRAGA